MAASIIWLATMPPERLGSGRFWHDRRPRPEYPLPWTREHDPAARELWDQLAAATATGTPKLRNKGRIAWPPTMTSLRRGRDDRAAAI